MNDVLAAAKALRAGRLVAFPTETVYGLGANALDAEAVAQIYARKKRPRTSPLIVHVRSVEMAQSLVLEWPTAAIVLAGRYWPGPLTLVLPKKASIPDIVTAGLSTVGLRVPAHPVALDLLRAAGIPVAAPSANRFTGLSPTTAAHVRESLGEDLLVLDGGPSAVGIESTVLSLVGAPRLLRPGSIPLPELESLIGAIGVADFMAEGAAHSSPGQHARHYQPRTRLFFAQAELPAGRGAYLYWNRRRDAARALQMPAGPGAYAALLYSALHDLDAAGFDWIAVEPPPAGPEWAGILDRLTRAARPVAIPIE
jgi:L-threonylcarbamoyladenylate synthase